MADVSNSLFFKPSHETITVNSLGIQQIQKTPLTKTQTYTTL